MSLRPSEAPLRCPCQARSFGLVFSYESPPEGETRFAFARGPYRREIWRCDLCGHFVSRHDMDMSRMYSGDYVSSTYAGVCLREAFERIIRLPSDRSDNVGRVRRVLAFAQQRLPGVAKPSVLDVGSGLCVFLYAMRNEGWRCTAVDPDERAARHARETVGVEAIHGDFLQVSISGPFDVITFNKVLEHVVDPVAMLARAAPLLAAQGFVYAEVPDGEAASNDGPGREEFMIDHPHVFSAASFALLGARAGLSPAAVERLREPSGKYTLRGLFVSLRR